MEITLDALLEGKETIIKDKPYYKTSDYVSPFIDQMSKFTEKFIVKVTTPDQMSITNGEEDLIYNRCWIQAVMPDSYTVDNHQEVYGLIYGLDVRNPVYKVYRGNLNAACLNLCLFNPQWQQVYELKPEESFTYSIKSLMEQVSDMEAKLRVMKSTYLSTDDHERHRLLGHMLEKSILMEHRNLGGKVKISNSTVIKAYEDVYLDQRSRYYVGDQESSVFNYYNAFTEILRDEKDIINPVEKVLLVNSLFGL